MELLTLVPGSDRIPGELFQILKDDAEESAALNMLYALNMQYAGSQHPGMAGIYWADFFGSFSYISGLWLINQIWFPLLESKLLSKAKHQAIEGESQRR